MNVKKQKKRAKRTAGQIKKDVKRLITLLIILFLLAGIANLNGKVVKLTNIQKTQSHTIQQQQVQMQKMEAGYKVILADQAQRIQQLEDRPTYTYTPVEEQQTHKAPEPKQEQHKQEKGTVAEGPSISPMVPIAGVLTVLQGVKNMLLPLGGH